MVDESRDVLTKRVLGEKRISSICENPGDSASLAPPSPAADVHVYARWLCCLLALCHKDGSYYPVTRLSVIQRGWCSNPLSLIETIQNTAA